MTSKLSGPRDSSWEVLHDHQRTVTLSASADAKRARTLNIYLFAVFTSRLRNMKKLIRAVAHRMGFDVVRLTSFHRDLGDHLRQVLAAKEIDAVIDVGANVGQYGRLLRDLGFTGHIYSFEPVRAVFDRLQLQAAGDDQWHCICIALGEHNAKKTINVYDNDVFSSFLQANDYSKGTWKSVRGVREETVDVARLDEVLDQLPDRESCHRFLLKMDTQGFDRNVFRGASGCLGDIHALQTELALIPIYDATPDPFELLAEFREKDYLISGMYAINRDESLAVIEYDVTLVRRNK